jgi:hypothetical protein
MQQYKLGFSSLQQFAFDSSFLKNSQLSLVLGKQHFLRIINKSPYRETYSTDQK